MTTYLITGAGSGLGAALAERLAWDGSKTHSVFRYDLAAGYDVRAPNVEQINEFAHASQTGCIDVLINCAAVNKIEWLENVNDQDWDDVVNTNAKGIFKMTQACLPHLIRSKGTVVNIVSNAAHMPMTCSLAYNASKGAAHIMTLQLARELTKKYGITVFGVAPNKMSGTGMSDSIDEQVVRTRGWTKEEAQRYQLTGLLTGEETPVERVAEFIAWLLEEKDRHRFLTGTVIPYGA